MLNPSPPSDIMALQETLICTTPQCWGQPTSSEASVLALSWPSSTFTMPIESSLYMLMITLYLPSDGSSDTARCHLTFILLPIFSAAADGLAWIIYDQGVSRPLQYLDDILFFGAPASHEYARNLRTALEVCHHLGIPIAIHKYSTCLKAPPSGSPSWVSNLT